MYPSAAMISIPGPNMVNGNGSLPIAPTVKNHFRDTGLSESCDPAEYRSASYWPDPLENLEPLPDNPNPYRQAALKHLQVLDAIDRLVQASTDARLAWIGISLALRLTSTRGFAVAEIARQLGIPESAFNRLKVKFANSQTLIAPSPSILFGVDQRSNGTEPVQAKCLKD
jgi:hypothetical protein